MSDYTDAKNSSCAVYPSFPTCKWLTLKNVFFAFTKWDFSLLMGAVYFLLSALISLLYGPTSTR
ncbi:hypothetical protein [Bradyrhizobium sp. I1.7.5]|uniref:hypothetical protein n=1 Tax=Bradyrhizobium sp. I1.7.5 TaxID=3156363 RepID=UPI003390F2E0